MTNDQWLSSLDAVVTEEHRRLFERNRKRGWAGIKAALNETRETADPDLVPYVMYLEAITERDGLSRELNVQTKATGVALIIASIGWALAIGLAVLR